MKTTFSYILSLLMLLMATMSFTSCKDDDDNEEKIHLSCPDSHHPHMIDLGLPSGTKWACCNVGASYPYDYGRYYAWGETEEKFQYDWSTYIHCDGSEKTCHNLGDGAIISGTQYDVARVKWGESWRLPYDGEQRELLSKCTWTSTTIYGVKGQLVTGSNGNCVFFPLAGYRTGNLFFDRDFRGHYMSGVKNPPGRDYWFYDMVFDEKSGGWSSNARCNGYSVRPVASR
ncbi:MAG: hypothetical protein J6S65_00940 [Bacteroidaceae bacterium]|nr:hypothetical protein [Bacteroidaceae bacterium]